MLVGLQPANTWGTSVRSLSWLEGFCTHLPVYRIYPQSVICHFGCTDLSRLGFSATFSCYCLLHAMPFQDPPLSTNGACAGGHRAAGGVCRGPAGCHAGLPVLRLGLHGRRPLRAGRRQRGARFPPAPCRRALFPLTHAAWPRSCATSRECRFSCRCMQVQPQPGGHLVCAPKAGTCRACMPATWCWRARAQVRRQFRERPGIMEYREKPDYARCVSIVAASALRVRGG